MLFTLAAAATTPPGPLFDWVALLKVIAISLGAGVGVVAIASATILFHADATTHQGARKLAGSAAAILGVLTITAVIVVAITVMMAK